MCLCPTRSQDYLKYVKKVSSTLRKLPRPPRTDKKSKFAMDNEGEILLVRRARGKKQKEWMKETVERRTERFANIGGTVSRLGHVGHDMEMRREFCAVIQPLRAIEKALLGAPLGKDTFDNLLQARENLNNRLVVLQVARETNSTVANLVETKILKGGMAKTITVAVERWQKMPGNRKGGKQQGNRGGGGNSNRERRSYSSK
jgi:hypothetical protein